VSCPITRQLPTAVNAVVQPAQSSWRCSMTREMSTARLVFSTSKKMPRRLVGRTAGGSGGGTWATKPGSGRLVTITGSTGASGLGWGTSAGGSSISSGAGAASTGFGFRGRYLLVVLRGFGDGAPVLRERVLVVTRRDIARVVGEFSLPMVGPGVARRRVDSCPGACESVVAPNAGRKMEHVDAARLEHARVRDGGGRRTVPARRAGGAADGEAALRCHPPRRRHQQRGGADLVHVRRGRDLLHDRAGQLQG